MARLWYVRRKNFEDTPALLSSLLEPTNFSLPLLVPLAYINDWLSVYNDDWCRYPSTQVHELGHNLGLYHAGDGSDPYGDQTGFMGYSYQAYDQKMCYNSVNHWQLGWYSLRRDVLDFGSRGGFSGSLVGITDYQNSGAVGRYVHLMIPGSSKTLYLGFNRADGINANTQEAWNQVTVHTQSNSSEKTPLILAKLSAASS